MNKKVVICNFRFTVTSALSSLRTILGRFGKRRAQRTAQVGSWILARMQLLEIRLEISEGVMKSNPSLSGGRVGREMPLCLRADWCQGVRVRQEKRSKKTVFGRTTSCAKV